MKKPLNTLNKPKEITLKQFLKEFNFNNPDWIHLPKNFPQCDLDELSSTEVGQFSAIQTLWQLSHPKKATSKSRVWQDPKGYQYLGIWQNAALLRILVRKFTFTLPLNRTLNKPLEYRLKAQMDDAARSVKRNVEEGWKRATTSEYLQFLSYSQGSLEELRGDIRDCKTDGLLPSKPLSTLKNTLHIDLRVAKGPQKGKAWGEPTNPDHPYYKPLSALNPRNLTFEVFIELISKTDYLLRVLVESLEKKLTSDKLSYKVNQSRIKSNLKLK